MYHPLCAPPTVHQHNLPQTLSFRFLLLWPLTQSEPGSPLPSTVRANQSPVHLPPRLPQPIRETARLTSPLDCPSQSKAQLTCPLDYLSQSERNSPAHLSPRLTALPLQQDLELVGERRDPLRLVATAALEPIPSLRYRGRRGDRHVRLRHGVGTERRRREGGCARRNASISDLRETPRGRRDDASPAKTAVDAPHKAKRKTAIGREHCTDRAKMVVTHADHGK